MSAYMTKNQIIDIYYLVLCQCIRQTTEFICDYRRHMWNTNWLSRLRAIFVWHVSFLICWYHLKLSINMRSLSSSFLTNSQHSSHIKIFILFPFDFVKLFFYNESFDKMVYERSRRGRYEKPTKIHDDVCCCLANPRSGRWGFTMGWFFGRSFVYCQKQRDHGSTSESSILHGSMQVRTKYIS